MDILHPPAQIYSFRVPSPPRVLVPPPELNANGMPDFDFAPDSTFDFESSGFANAEFLKTVTYGNLLNHNSVFEWKYEQRRTAQQILPFLFLGPMSAAKDRSFLQSQGITMVLAVRNTMSAQAQLLGSKAAQELGIVVKSIDVAGNQELIAAFPKGIEAINEHLSQMYRLQQTRAMHATAITGGHTPTTSGKVLVFCESGNERSASLVTAYIMAMYSTDLVKAIQIVQAQRFAVAFNDSLRDLLLTYSTILQAKRDVVRAHVPAAIPYLGVATATGNNAERTTNPGRSTKRTLHDANDDDTDMDIDGGHMQMDDGRFEKRDGHAPF